MTFQRTGPGAQAPTGGSSSASKMVMRKRHGRSAWRFLAVVVVAALAFLVSIPYWSGTPAAPVVSSPLPVPPPIVIKETEIVTVEVEVERIVVVPADRITPEPAAPVEKRPATVMVVPILTLPASGSTSRNPVRFEWEGQLRPGQAYRVTAYQIGGEGGEQSPQLTDTGWEVTFDGSTYGGWRWVVAILEGERVVAISEVGQFWFDPFADSVGGGE